MSLMHAEQLATFSQTKKSTTKWPNGKRCVRCPSFVNDTRAKYCYVCSDELRLERHRIRLRNKAKEAK